MNDKYFIDASVLFDFFEVGRLDLLERLYKVVCITERVDRQVVRSREKYEVYRDVFRLIYPEPEWEAELARLKRKHGLGVGDVDRGAAIAAKYSGGVLLTRDKMLIAEAKEFLDMRDEDFVGTVAVLRRCVEGGLIDKAEAIRLCHDISEERCRKEDLDCSELERL